MNKVVQEVQLQQNTKSLNQLIPSQQAFTLFNYALRGVLGNPHIYLIFFFNFFYFLPQIFFLRSKFYGGSCPTLEKIFLTTSVSEGIYPEKILKSVQRLDYIYIFLSKYKRLRILLPIKSLNVTGTQPKQSQQQMFNRLS